MVFSREGSAAQVTKGRVVVDCTWYHFFDINLIGDRYLEDESLGQQHAQELHGSYIHDGAGCCVACLQCAEDYLAQPNGRCASGIIKKVLDKSKIHLSWQEAEADPPDLGWWVTPATRAACRWLRLAVCGPRGGG